MRARESRSGRLRLKFEDRPGRLQNESRPRVIGSHIPIPPVSRVGGALVRAMRITAATTTRRGAKVRERLDPQEPTLSRGTAHVCLYAIHQSTKPGRLVERRATHCSKERYVNHCKYGHEGRVVHCVLLPRVQERNPRRIAERYVFAGKRSHCGLVAPRHLHALATTVSWPAENERRPR